MFTWGHVTNQNHYIFTITMSKVTRLIMVVIYCKELATIYLHDLSIKWSFKVRWQIKYITSPLAEEASKLGKVLSYRERFPPFKPHQPWITWPTWGYVTIWKIYISAVTRLMANKSGKVLTYGRRFSTETLQSSPTSCSN